MWILTPACNFTGRHPLYDVDTDSCLQFHSSTSFVWCGYWLLLAILLVYIRCLMWTQTPTCNLTGLHPSYDVNTDSWLQSYYSTSFVWCWYWLLIAILLAYILCMILTPDCNLTGLHPFTGLHPMTSILTPDCNLTTLHHLYDVDTDSWLQSYWPTSFVWYWLLIAILLVYILCIMWIQTPAYNKYNGYDWKKKTFRKACIIDHKQFQLHLNPFIINHTQFQ